MHREVSKPVRLFIACSGLGRIRRGLESFADECFRALSTDPSLDVTLFKGGGKSSDRQKALLNLPRNLGLAGKYSYWLEEISFGIALLPFIVSRKPDVIMYSDPHIGNVLWHWRKRTRQTFTLLFSNGAPWPPPFDKEDHVHQVTPLAIEKATEAGEPLEKQTLVPYALDVSPDFQRVRVPRRPLGLPEDRPVLLTVGALNAFHKRMDYVVREVARLPVPRPFLMLLGQTESETPEVLKLARDLLGEENFQARAVPRETVADYYRTADAFVLGSLVEGFGRVYLEALNYGLPVLAHDGPSQRFVLDGQAFLGDFTVTGELAARIPKALSAGIDPQRHRYVYEKFSWDALRPAYVELIHLCARR